MKNEKLSKLHPYKQNAKKHPQKQVRQIADSIKEFGFNQPIVVDQNDVIVVGHGRWEAAKLLGLKTAPVIKINISEEKVKAYRLADNKLNESEWDMGLVIEELRGLSEEMVDLTGFDGDLLIEQDEKDDIIPDNAPTMAKLGDIWALGRHRVMCGDSTKKDDVEKLMDGKKAAMVFTDPPYGVDFKYNQYDDSKGKENHKEFCRRWLTLIKEFTKFAVITGGYGNQQIFFELEPSFNTMVWYKKFGISRGFVAFATLTEPIYVWGKIPKLRYDTDFFEFATDREKELHEKHPCPKPVGLVDALIIPQTKADDIVLDIFLGSGSTVIAAEKTGRICYGMEIDPCYVDVIVKRWEDYTNGKAIKIKP